MIFLALRLFLAPLAVLASTVVQRRFGHAISGLMVGLPLASLPLLWLIALQHGDAFASTMTAALLVGGIACLLYTSESRAASPGSDPGPRGPFECSKATTTGRRRSRGP